jgi:Outer membrane protein beta-barrel domain
MKKLILALLMYFSWDPLFAQMYMELGASVVGYSNTFAGARIETRQHIANLLIGKGIAPNWSAEFMTGLSKISNDPVYLNGVEMHDLSINFNKAYGVYLKRQHAVNDHISLFVRAGYASLKGSANYQGESDSFTAEGVSYGLGTAYQIDEEKYVNLNYFSFLEKDNLRIKVVGVHYGQRF